ncbi:MAG: hypothetical protein U0793_10035 [Gemmataceae bacterium]
MVREFGMSRLGRVFYQESAENPFLAGSMSDGDRSFSEETAREIDLEVRRIIDEALEAVRVLIAERRPALEALAKKLFEKEVIEGSEVHQIIESQCPGPKLVPGSAAIIGAEKEEGTLPETGASVSGS